MCKNLLEIRHQKSLMSLEKRYYDSSYIPVGEIQTETKKIKLQEFDCKIALIELQYKSLEESIRNTYLKK